MNTGQSIVTYFSHLDAGDRDAAFAMFAPEGRIDTPWEAGIAPGDFIAHHLASAPTRHHEVLDVLVSTTGPSAAAHFEYRSEDEDGTARPTFVGCDHFTFGPDGRIEVLSVYCHAKG